MSNKISIQLDRTILILFKWLESRSTEEALAWLNGKIAVITQTTSEKILFTTFSAVPRYMGKAELNLSIDELENANQLIQGWKPINWTVDQVGRTLLLLHFESQDRDRYVATIDKILAAADVGETVAFYQSLPLLPHPEAFRLRAAEGIRSNMTSVFNAVALNNPYPAKYLDDLAWNQMILKALFVGTPLHPIYDLERRNNPQLCQILIDYANERLAAKRTVSPELWELVKPFNPKIVTKLKQLSQTVCS